jgi:hypothetical protein
MAGTALLFASLVGAALGGHAANAQPVAQAPEWKPGDRWEFRSTTTPGDKEGKWSREIVQRAGDDKIEVRIAAEKVEQYDAALNPLPQGRLDYRRTFVRYPLRVGDEWSYTRKFDNPNLEETGKAKVEAYEKISVPAGTFDCYRIEIRASWGAMGASEENHWTRWYCPQVKWIAKERHETRRFNRRTPGGETIATSELVSFTPGN